MKYKYFYLIILVVFSWRNFMIANDSLSRFEIQLAESLPRSENIYVDTITPIREEVLATEQTDSDTTAHEIRVTNVFYDTDLLEALRIISGQTGITIVTDGNVSGTISLELNDLPLEECLKRILYPLGFSFRKIDDYYLVGTNRAENASFHLLAKTEYIKLNYLSAKDVNPLIPDIYRPYIKINPDIDMIIIKAPSQIIQTFKEDLANIDKPKRQIQIEALITEVSSDALQEMGINWSGKVSKGTDTVNVLANFAKLTETSTELVFKTISTSLGGDWTYTMMMPTIEALVQKGKAEIKANPKIITLEGQKASIVVGKEKYYQMASGNVQYPYYHFEVVKYGTSLNITPIISDSNEITVEVEPEVSDFIGEDIDKMPVLSKRSVKTRIRVNDGDKIVIGGLKSKNQQVLHRKIPILGDIPLLGFLFRYNHKVVSKTDVIIIITPRILK